MTKLRQTLTNEMAQTIESQPDENGLCLEGRTARKRGVRNHGCAAHKSGDEPERGERLLSEQFCHPELSLPSVLDGDDGDGQEPKAGLAFGSGEARAGKRDEPRQGDRPQQ